MAERALRRLAAIVAADVVGYSRLIGADEEGTLEALKGHRQELIDPLIAEHGGRIVKTMGDGLLLEFPSVVDATRCAIMMQQGMVRRNVSVDVSSQITFRIGVNLGDIVIDGDDILGDGVNVAARLEALAEPGAIFLSGSAYEQVRDKLSLTFEDRGEQRVKNIDRPVHVYRLIDSAMGTVGGMQRRSQSRRKTYLAVTAAVATTSLISAVALWWLHPWRPTILPLTVEVTSFLTGKPSIAVIPFSNLSGDQAEDYLSDGLSDDIINALGRYRSLAVMTYNATLPYRNEASLSAEARRKLGVKYLLEGSVRRAGNQIRVLARLTDAITGVLVWSERFDKNMEDVFSVQDAITRRIAGTLVTNLREEELKRAATKPPGSLDAYEFVLQGRALLTQASRHSNRQARELFQKALELDSNYAAAYAWLGRAHYEMATDGWAEFPAEALARAEDYAAKALAIDPDLVDAHRTLGRIYAIQFQLDRAISEIDRAVELNPSDAEAHGDRGLVLLWIGRLQDALAEHETAFALDPNLRGDYVFAHGLTLYSLRRNKEAIQILERGAARYPTYAFIPVVLVAAYGQIDRLAEARRNADKVKQLLPFFNPKVFGSRFQDKALYDYLTDGLRKGGLL
jgi:adenylate cyclase